MQDLKKFMRMVNLQDTNKNFHEVNCDAKNYYMMLGEWYFNPLTDSVDINLQP